MQCHLNPDGKALEQLVEALTLKPKHFVEAVFCQGVQRRGFLNRFCGLSDFMLHVSYSLNSLSIYFGVINGDTRSYSPAKVDRIWGSYFSYTQSHILSTYGGV